MQLSSVSKAHPRWLRPGGRRRQRLNGCSRIWDRGSLHKNTTSSIQMRHCTGCLSTQNCFLQSWRRSSPAGSSRCRCHAISERPRIC